MKKLLCAIVAVVALLLGNPLSSYAGGGGQGGHGGGWHGGGGHGAGWHGGGWHGGGGHWGHGGGVVFVGPGFWGPWWYGAGYPYYSYPYYSYPYYGGPPAVVQQDPQVYIQQSEPQPQTNYWYYCQNPQGYYPQVPQCPGGWMTVVPPTNAPPR